MPAPTPRAIARTGACLAPARRPPRNAAIGGTASMIQHAEESSSGSEGSTAFPNALIASRFHGQSRAAIEPAATTSTHEPDAGTSSSALWVGSDTTWAPNHAAPVGPSARRPST
jgi:hypothetical protein